MPVACQRNVIIAVVTCKSEALKKEYKKLLQRVPLENIDYNSFYVKEFPDLPLAIEWIKKCPIQNINLDDVLSKLFNLHVNEAIKSIALLFFQQFEIDTIDLDQLCQVVDRTCVMPAWLVEFFEKAEQSKITAQMLEKLNAVSVIKNHNVFQQMLTLYATNSRLMNKNDCRFFRAFTFLLPKTKHPAKPRGVFNLKLETGNLKFGSAG